MRVAGTCTLDSTAKLKLNPEDRAVVSPGRPRTEVTAAAKPAATGEVCRATATL